jgi:O-6-methylguanine DNA methyltransferase
MKKPARYSVKDFRKKVLETVKKIPKGKTLSYGQVATKAGHPRAARAVGAIMASNKDKSVPCHRVIRADGKIGGYNGLQGTKNKAALLRREGVRI